ncbi:hypothetical protein D3C75_992680 [compost metagenome]
MKIIEPTGKCRPLSRLCPATMSSPRANRVGLGSQTSMTRAIMLTLMAQITCMLITLSGNWNVQAKFTEVNSSRARNRPRLNRKA